MPDSPRMITAGRWPAWAGLSMSAGFHTVTEGLIAAAVAVAKAHDGWCKLMGDWDLEAAPVPYELLRAAVDGVHAAGGRVAAHCQTAEGVLGAARAGVDSIEHGMGMPLECVELMAAHHTAYVPTLTPFAHDAPGIKDNARGRLWLDGHRTMIRRVREAYDAGVTVLAGTDSAPFGDVATEVEHLVAAGLPTEAAVGAASWPAREFLGLTGPMEGGLADITVYDTDPRRDPGVLRHPRRIVLRGGVVRWPPHIRAVPPADPTHPQSDVMRHAGALNLPGGTRVSVRGTRRAAREAGICVREFFRPVGGGHRVHRAAGREARFDARIVFQLPFPSPQLPASSRAAGSVMIYGSSDPTG